MPVGAILVTGMQRFYEYGPFGEPVRVSCPLAAVNPFRFSTDYADQEFAWINGKHRPYIPPLGRFASRDPLGDEAFFQRYVEKKGGWTRSSLEKEALKPVYAFVGNDPISNIDGTGLDRWIVDGGIHPYIVVKEMKLGDAGIYWSRKYLTVNFMPGDAQGVDEASSKGDLVQLVSAFGISISDAIATMGTLGLISRGMVNMGYGEPSGRKITSSCTEDYGFIQSMQSLRGQRIPYSFWFYNCRHFVWQHAGDGMSLLSPKPMTSGYIPLYQTLN